MKHKRTDYKNEKDKKKKEWDELFCVQLEPAFDDWWQGAYEKELQENPEKYEGLDGTLKRAKIITTIVESHKATRNQVRQEKEQNREIKREVKRQKLSLEEQIEFIREQKEQHAKEDQEKDSCEKTRREKEDFDDDDEVDDSSDEENEDEES